MPPVNDICKILADDEQDSQTALAVGKVLFVITFMLHVPIYIKNSIVLSEKIKQTLKEFSWDRLVPDSKNITLALFRATALLLTLSRNSIFFQNSQDNVRGVFFDKDASLTDFSRSFVFIFALAGAMGKVPLNAIAMDNLAKYLYEACSSGVKKVSDYFYPTPSLTTESFATQQNQDLEDGLFQSIKSAVEWITIISNATFNGILGIPREDAVVAPWMYFVIKASISLGLGSKGKIEKIDSDKMIQCLLAGDDKSLKKILGTQDENSQKHFLEVMEKMASDIKESNSELGEKLEEKIALLRACLGSFLTPYFGIFLALF